MSAGAGIVVETPFGKVRGGTAKGVTHFHRIPYAEAPSGRRRFQPPGSPPQWTGVYEAAVDKVMPPQRRSRLADIIGDYPIAQDENCLHLDIWVPPIGGGNVPVLVFLHGGAFLTGGGSLPCYDGRLLAARTGLIVVNVTYRLGVLGFLYAKGVTRPNLGLLDQIAALRWIRRSISAFGGDVARITVAGQSAGGYSIALMLASGFGAELFDRAILMSAPLGLAPEPLEAGERVMADFVAALGLRTDQAGDLLNMPLDRLLEAQQSLLRRPRAEIGDITPPLMPLNDGDLVAADPFRAINCGAGAWCDVMIGVTREEHSAFYLNDPTLTNLSEDALRGVFRKRYGEHAERALRSARAARVPGSPVSLLSDLGTADTFTNPSIEFAARQGRNGRPAFFYQFDWQSPVAGLGACHCIDLPFLFGNLETWREAPMLAGANMSEVADLSGVFQDAVAAFARSGSPNCPTVPNWPAFNENNAMMHFDRRIAASGLVSQSMGGFDER